MKERRKSDRVRIKRPVFYTGTNTDDTMDAHGAGVAMDISADGMMFESDNPIDAMKILIQAASNSGEAIKVKGFLIYSRPDAERKYRCAIKFNDAPDRIARFIDALVGRAL